MSQHDDPCAATDRHDDGERTRRCVATGETRAPEELFRFVLSPEGVVTPDFSGALPGRGAWVTASRVAVDTAIKKRAFGRAFKQDVETPANLPDIVMDGLRRAALNALGLARRSGDAVTGFEKALAALKDKKAGVAVLANDLAENSSGKLLATASSSRVEIIAEFTGEELSLALGRPAMTVAIKPGACADRFLRAAEKVRRFRGMAA